MPNVTDPAHLLASMQITMIRAPMAPGLFVAFAKWLGRDDLPLPVSELATGKGLSREQALAGCLGEMAENLSIGTAAHPFPVPAAPLFQTASDDLATDARSIDLSNPDDPGSEGCAAHPDPDQAALRAAHERIERAAIALWWQGRCPATRLDLPDLAPWRQQQAGRQTTLWQLQPVPHCPVVMAVSQDVGGGRLAFGSSAAPTRDAAITAALHEVMLAEVAFLAPPAHPDHQRATRLNTALQNRLVTLPEAALCAQVKAPAPDPADDLFSLIDRLRHAGHPLAFADLTCPGVGLTVIRCICPTLPSARPLLR